MTKTGVLSLGFKPHGTSQAFLEATDKFSLNPSAQAVFDQAAMLPLSQEPREIEVLVKTIKDITGRDAPTCEKVLKSIQWHRGLLPFEVVLALRERGEQLTRELATALGDSGRVPFLPFAYVAAYLPGFSPVLIELRTTRSELVIRVLDNPKSPIQGYHAVVLGLSA